jgi:uncharacterized membrane protein
MTKSNIRAWVTLVVLSSLNYFLPDKFDKNAILILLILFILVKVILVALQFMELKKAHPMWLVLVGFALLLYGGFIIALN